MELLALLALLVLSFPIWVIARLGQLSEQVRKLEEQLTALRRQVSAEAAPRPLSDTGREQPTARPQPAPPAVAPTRAEPVAPAPPPVVRPPAPAPPPPPAPRPAPTVPPAPPRPEVTPTPAPARAVARPQPSAGPPPPPPVRPVAPRAPFDIEEVLGANWLAKLGVVAIAIAAVFFLKYAIDSGWISPALRVLIGVAVAGTLYGLGQWLLRRPRYRVYAQVLASGGVMIFFLSIYAAYNLYHLIGYGVAFGILAVAAIAASAMTVPNNTQAVAALCLAGAFATPVLIRQEGGGGGDLVALYLYLTLVDLWTAVMVTARPWPALLALSFGATWAIFFGAGSLQTLRPWPPEVFAALFLLFSCYAGVMLLRSETAQETDWAAAGVVLMLAGFVCFGAASALLLAQTTLFGLPAVASMGAFAVLVAIALPRAIRGDGEIGRATRRLLHVLASSILLLMFVVPVAAAPAMATAEAAGGFAFAVVVYLLLLAAALDLVRSQRSDGTVIPLLVVNAAAQVVAAFHTLAPVRVAGVQASALWLPLAGWLGLLALPAARRSERFSALLLWLAQLFTLIAAGASLLWAHAWPTQPALLLFGGEFLLISLTWVLLRRFARVGDFRGDLFGAGANAILFFAIATVIAGLEKAGGLVIVSGCALGFAAYHGLVGAALRRAGDDALSRAAHCAIAVSFVTIAIPLQWRDLSLTAAWAGEGIVLIAAGLALRAHWLRWYGAWVAVAAVGKVLALDLPAEPSPYHPLLNARFLSGLCAASAAYLGGLLYWRRRGELAADERTLPVLGALAGTLLVLTFASFEIYQYLGYKASPAAREYTQQAGLTLLWCAGAAVTVFAGLRARSRPVRSLGLVLLTLALGKPLLADLMMNPVPFRLLANARIWCGLGAIAAAYLTAWMLRREEGESLPEIRAALLVLASVFTVSFVSRDLWDHFARANESTQFLALTLFWSAYAVAVICVAVWARSRLVRVIGLVVLGLALGKAAVIDLMMDPVPFHLLANARAWCGLAAIAGAYLAVWVLRREEGESLPEIRAALLVLASVFTVSFVSRDLWDHFARANESTQLLALTLLWSAYAVAVISVAARTRSRLVRAIGLVVLGLVVGKAALVDLMMDPVPFHLLANARAWCGLAAIAAAYLTVVMLRREGDEVATELRPVLLVLANAYTLVFISVDLWQQFGLAWIGPDRQSAQQLSLSIFWSCYALIVLCVGIWRRVRLVRLFAMGLLYVSILKVFLLDLSFLATPYRIVSFLGLGVILLVVSLLYTRFEAQVREAAAPPRVA